MAKRLNIRCLLGFHRYGNVHCLTSLKIWYVQCERCGRMLKVAAVGGNAK